MMDKKMTTRTKTATAKRLGLGGLLVGAGLMAGGCVGLAKAIVMDSPLGVAVEIQKDIRRAGASNVNVNVGEQGRNSNDPWAGTPIVNQYNTPDGDMVFIADANKVNKQIWASDIDNYVDLEKYYRASSKSMPQGKIMVVYHKKE